MHKAGDVLQLMFSIVSSLKAVELYERVTSESVDVKQYLLLVGMCPHASYGFSHLRLYTTPTKIAVYNCRSAPYVQAFETMEVKSVPKSVLSASRCVMQCVTAIALIQTAACTSTSRTSTADSSAASMSEGSASPFDKWQHYPLPGKEATNFTVVKLDGRDVVAASADASASMLRRPVRMEAADLGKIKFSWMVPQLIGSADMAVRQADDSPVRVVLAFEGDRSKFSMKNAMLSELSLTITGEALPYATLMYVWCNTRPPGSVIVNPRTDRIRKLVVESGANGLSRWLSYERNILADFEKAFGEPPGALVGIGIMTDTDNTRTKVHAWYGPLDFSPGK
jgi:hypothetical protein